jgi:hypothetical protein
MDNKDSYSNVSHSAMDEIPPPMPPRPVSQQGQQQQPLAEDSYRNLEHPATGMENPPPYMPPGPTYQQEAHQLPLGQDPYDKSTYSAMEKDDIPPQMPLRPVSQGKQQTQQGLLDVHEYYGRPPQRRSLISSPEGGEDISSPIHYARDPHKLIAYLVPFPKPIISSPHRVNDEASSAESFPERFLIYTPPPPPLKAPQEGTDSPESKIHKVQRKWQEEVRNAKASDAKVTSWKGIRSRVTKGINTAMGWTTTSNLDFLNRIADKEKSSKAASSTSSTSDTTKRAQSPNDLHSDDGVHEEAQTKRTVGLTELILIYPASLPGNEAQIRQEFVDSMLRSKNKAQRDAVIATGLIPVSAAIDILATFIWPFGGLLEIDSVWAYSSIRGAKTARSVTKRLNSSSASTASKADNLNAPEGEAALKLSFSPSPRLDILRNYLAAQCTKRDPKLFPTHGGPEPTETEVLEAIGWSPSQTGDTKNWEDEQWEITEVKDDLRSTMSKGAREWDKWCAAFQKNPAKALKK